MKKVNLSLIGLVTMVTLCLGFSSCGGGGSNSSNSNPFVGTWELTFSGTSTPSYEIQIRESYSENGTFTWINSDSKTYATGTWKREAVTYGIFNTISFRHIEGASGYGDGNKFVIDDSGTTGTMYYYGGGVMGKMKKK